MPQTGKSPQTQNVPSRSSMGRIEGHFNHKDVIFKIGPRAWAATVARTANVRLPSRALGPEPKQVSVATCLIH